MFITNEQDLIWVILMQSSNPITIGHHSLLRDESYWMLKCMVSESHNATPYKLFSCVLKRLENLGTSVTRVISNTSTIFFSCSSITTVTTRWYPPAFNSSLWYRWVSSSDSVMITPCVFLMTLCYHSFSMCLIAFMLIYQSAFSFNLVEHTSHHQLQEPGDYTDAPLSKKNNHKGLHA